mmetsp:Transcript_16273/g.67296  ORF Transcript_16273/g.67296 Transcript_16273/m.67296 type:complete len:207 (+) Transcript_16273:121-741(+)
MYAQDKSARDGLFRLSIPVEASIRSISSMVPSSFPPAKRRERRIPKSICSNTCTWSLMAFFCSSRFSFALLSLTKVPNASRLAFSHIETSTSPFSARMAVTILSAEPSLILVGKSPEVPTRSSEAQTSIASAFTLFTSSWETPSVNDTLIANFVSAVQRATPTKYSPLIINDRRGGPLSACEACKVVGSSATWVAYVPSAKTTVFS